MNKLVKGAVAGAAGIALLLGGASTFALWNASATASAGVVQSGQLKLEKAAAAGTWTDLSTSTPTTIANIADYRMVPGSKLQFSQPLTVTATGTNLRATLAASLPGSDSGLGAQLTKSFALTGQGGAALPTGFAKAGDAYTVTSTGTDPSAIVATYTIELPAGATGTAAQNGTLDLSKLTFTLTQLSLTGN